MPPKILSFGRAKPLHNRPQEAPNYIEPALLQHSSSEKRPSVTKMESVRQFAKDTKKTLVERPPSRKSKQQVAAPKVQLEINVESPPLVFYGNHENSTGALLGGQLEVDITDPEIKIQTLSMQLICTLQVKKPVSLGCSDCKIQTKEIHKWNFFSEPRTLVKQKHSFPFSYLLPGKLPQTTTTYQLGSIEYSLLATAITGASETFKCLLPLPVKRALTPPSFDRTSLRVFPPTHLKAELVHSPIMYPIGELECRFRLMDLTWCLAGNSYYRWQLIKLKWTIKEHTKLRSPACPKHMRKGEGAEGAIKGIEHTTKRTIGEGSFRTGWKTDFDTKVHPSVDPDPPIPPTPDDVTGLTEFEFKVSIKPNSMPACDIKDEDYGITITHVLTLDMQLAKLYRAGTAKDAAWIDTNAYAHGHDSSQLLRTNHGIILTERLGMGVSWDEEFPPMYEDVPSSPPRYLNSTIEDYVSDGAQGDSGPEELSLEQ